MADSFENPKLCELGDRLPPARFLKTCHKIISTNGKPRFVIGEWRDEELDHVTEEQHRLRPKDGPPRRPMIFS